jgi:hypothetical protein
MIRASKSNRVFLLQISWLLSAIVVAALACGCTSVNRLREAQDSFNQAATAENAARFDGSPSDMAASLVSGRSGYASALLSLNKLEPKDQQSLQKDGLWGTALTLKALCQWRLGQYSEAMSSAAEARNTGTNQVYPRDNALLTALPGLIKTDQAYARIIFTNAPANGDALLNDVKDLLTGPRGAIADLNSARGVVDKDHPIQVYLIQAELAAYRDYTVAVYYLKNHSPVAADDPARTHAIAQLKELADAVGAQKSDLEGRRLANYWATLCGLPQL